MLSRCCHGTDREGAVLYLRESDLNVSARRVRRMAKGARMALSKGVRRTVEPRKLLPGSRAPTVVFVPRWLSWGETSEHTFSRTLLGLSADCPARRSASGRPTCLAGGKGSLASRGSLGRRAVIYVLLLSAWRLRPVSATAQYQAKTTGEN